MEGKGTTLSKNLPGSSEEKQHIAEGMMGHLLRDPIINQQEWEEHGLLKWLRFSHCFPRQLKKEREDQRCLAQVWDIIYSLFTFASTREHSCNIPRNFALQPVQAWVFPQVAAERKKMQRPLKHGQSSIGHDRQR